MVNRYEIVVKLLLETRKVDIDSKNRSISNTAYINQFNIADLLIILKFLFNLCSQSN